MASHLASGRINLAVLRESYRRELLECLDRCTGSKALVWDEALTGPFSLIAEYSLLKEHGVDKMYPLAPGQLPRNSVANIIFICRPKLSLMDSVAQNVHREEEAVGCLKEFHIFFVPRKSMLCENKLKELGVHGCFTNIDEYCLNLIPFDYDLLSMEMESSFKECYLQNDETSLFYTVQALMTLQTLYGVIPNIYGKGELAKHVVDMMLRMRRETVSTEQQITPQIDNLLILDRMVDPLTPLLSQLTYEGLIDELFGIQNTMVKLPAENPTAGDSSCGGSQEGSSEPKKLALNSGEQLYAELRDKNFSAIGALLSRKAKLISAQFDERHSAKTVGEIKQFVSKLPHMQAARTSLSTHISIAQMVKELSGTDEFLDALHTQQDFFKGTDTDKPSAYIEDCIAKQEPILKVLRLVCIQCISNNGFRQKLLDYYKREIIQTYGFEHMITLQNLEAAGLLKREGHRSYPTLRKTLKLIVEEVKEQNPCDIAYVYSGYAPLSVRLAQFLHRPGWRSITEVLSLLPGPTIEEVQQIPIGLRKRRSSITSIQSGTVEPKVTLVLFLGGVTYAEISALRFLSQLEDAPAEYLVATTKLINGSNWIESIMETLSPKPMNPF
ncbi:Vacuolar protein sorting-associated protein 33A [Lamellibrachia satsuma]|nr:Vacuolar protein sorting-associated protein 33A [Lamellibrachia satsuma]